MRRCPSDQRDGRAAGGVELAHPAGSAAVRCFWCRAGRLIHGADGLSVGEIARRGHALRLRRRAASASETCGQRPQSGPGKSGLPQNGLVEGRWRLSVPLQSRLKLNGPAGSGRPESLNGVPARVCSASEPDIEAAGLKVRCGSQPARPEHDRQRPQSASNRRGSRSVRQRVLAGTARRPVPALGVC
jgi:hypothetical protein